MSSPGQITHLLNDLEQGDQQAADRLMPLIYHYLRGMAANLFRLEKPGHTLQPTALVHEAYLRLMRPAGRCWRNREHFYRIAARAMRRILIDHAREQGAGKRGGGWENLELDEALVYEPEKPQQLLALDDVLQRLEKVDPRATRVVELRFFAGLTVRETARVLGVGVTAVKDDWAFAKAWLEQELDNTP